MVLAALWLTLLAPSDPLGSGLHDGIRLVYESAGVRQAPWIYDAVAPVHRDSFPHCVLTTRRDQPPRESCARGDTLFQRSASGEYAAARPIGENMVLEVRTAAGAVVRYTTGAAAVRTIGALDVSYLPTTIVTRDADGVVVRRLREDYAPALLTALWGIFEEPDGEGGWRAVREFALAEILAGEAGRGAPPLRPRLP